MTAMRDIIRIVEAASILEGRDAPLYHATDIRTARRIMRHGALRASPRAIMGMPARVVSTSRSPRLRFGYDPDAGRGGEVQFVLRQATLARQFRIEPFSWAGAETLTKSTKHAIMHHRTESEEMVFGDIPITTEFVSKIVIEPNARIEQDVLYIVAKAEEVGIPVEDRRQMVSEGAADISIDADLDTLVDEARSVGVVLRVHVLPGKIVDLDLIQRRDGSKKGVGATVMRGLCAIADKHDFRIDTYVFAADDKLLSFYEAFGFVIDPEGDDEAMMMRLPKLHPMPRSEISP